MPVKATAIGFQCVLLFTKLFHMQGFIYSSQSPCATVTHHNFVPIGQVRGRL